VSAATARWLIAMVRSTPSGESFRSLKAAPALLIRTCSPFGVHSRTWLASSCTPARDPRSACTGVKVPLGLSSRNARVASAAACAERA
jgi:hypothetical protein